MKPLTKEDKEGEKKMGFIGNNWQGILGLFFIVLGFFTLTKVTLFNGIKIGYSSDAFLFGLILLLSQEITDLQRDKEGK